MTLEESIQSVIADHALKAQNSSYDRSVGIAAIARARAVIANIPAHGEKLTYCAELTTQLTDLHQTYHDPEGEFTNGKGILGSLIDDIYAAIEADKLHR